MSDERERRARPAWDFDYAPIPVPLAGDDAEPCDVVIATTREVRTSDLLEALRDLLEAPTIEILLERAPIHWRRARSCSIVRRSAVEAALRDAGIPVRYVASAVQGDLAHAALDTRGAEVARPSDWRARGPSEGDEPATRGRWFLGAGSGGIGVDRARCGGGAGTRLAIVDNDAAEAERLDLDAEVLVGVSEPPRTQHHGAMMVAWAVGCHAAAGPGAPGAFRGVAPDASPRLYEIPKPGNEVVWLPLAIARAVLDGADVVVCATYVEGTTSPMLDDALQVAARLGRRGRGTPVLMPTGREASSPRGSVHASWSLGFGDPASDPRIVCVGPSGHGEGWFLWRDRRGSLRPFANRGPAVRWLAPGDDLAYPFTEPERMFHAESSGASAVGAGALLLVLASNPTLRASELDAVVCATVERLDPRHPEAKQPLADPFDVLPVLADRDGHDAKHGYGRIDAGRACLAASDPIASALVAMGEADAARAFHDLRREDAALAGAYTPALARFAVRAALHDASLSHAIRALLRHLRLVAHRPERSRAHAPGSLVRMLAIVVGEVGASRLRPSPAVRRDIDALTRRIAAAARPDLDARAAAEGEIVRLACRAFGAAHPVDRQWT